MSSLSDAARAQQVRALCQLFLQDEAAPISKWLLRGSGVSLEWGVVAERPSGVRVAWREGRGRRVRLLIDEQGRCLATPAAVAAFGDAPDAPWRPVSDATHAAMSRGAGLERGLMLAALAIMALALGWTATEAASARDVVLGLAGFAAGLALGESARAARSGDCCVPVTLAPATAQRVREQLAATYATARERVARAQSLAGD